MLHKDVLKYFDDQIKNSRLRHMYLLAGEKGRGKKTLAKGLAKKILCTSETEIKPCGRCLSCRTFESGANADYILIQTDNSTISISESRRIIDALGLRPIVSNRKVVVICDSHKLTNQAQNSLLKVIEDPPDYAVLIMTAADKDILLDTILSRTVSLSLKPQSIDDIKEAFPEASAFQLRFGSGNIGKTIEASSVDFQNKRQKAIRLIEYIINKDTSSIDEKEYLNDIDEELSLMLILLRDMLLLSVNAGNIINIDQEHVLRRLSESTNYIDIIRLVKKVKKAGELTELNTNKRVVFNNLIYGKQGGA